MPKLSLNDLEIILLTLVIVFTALTLVGLTFAPYEHFLSSRINRLLYGEMKAKPQDRKEEQ